MSIALALSIVGVAYNNLVNRWGPFHSWAYVPANLAFASAIVVFATTAQGISWQEIAPLGRPHPLAIAAVLLFGVLLFAIVRSRHAHRIADKRVAGLAGPQLAYHLLLRIPVGTALFEELLFRGVLMALWRDAGFSIVGAAIASSLAFGLWHIAPSAIGLRMNDPAATQRAETATVLGAVLATLVAGMFLCWVRVQTDGLISPVLLHAGVNSLGAWAAVIASRRTNVRLEP